MAEVIETRTGRTWIRNDGILGFEGRPDAELSGQHAVESVAATLRAACGTPRRNVLCLRHVREMSRDTRSHYARPRAANAQREAALWSEASIARVTREFILGRSKSAMPIRSFTSEHDALAWLHTFVR